MKPESKICGCPKCKYIEKLKEEPDNKNLDKLLEYGETYEVKINDLVNPYSGKLNQKTYNSEGLTSITIAQVLVHINQITSIHKRTLEKVL
jgi:hypothetical protein